MTALPYHAIARFRNHANRITAVFLEESGWLNISKPLSGGFVWTKVTEKGTAQAKTTEEAFLIEGDLQ